MELLLYKGIIFDNWTIDTDEDGNVFYWSEMCGKHAEQHKEFLENELSEGGCGACSVCGCTKIGADEIDEKWYYIDFKTEDVIIRDFEMQSVREELNYRDQAGSDSRWDDDLYEYTTEELQAIEISYEYNYNWMEG